MIKSRKLKEQRKSQIKIQYSKLRSLKQNVIFFSCVLGHVSHINSQISSFVLSKYVSDASSLYGRCLKHVFKASTETRLRDGSTEVIRRIVLERCLMPWSRCLFTCPHNSSFCYISPMHLSAQWQTADDPSPENILLCLCCYSSQRRLLKMTYDCSAVSQHMRDTSPLCFSELPLLY